MFGFYMCQEACKLGSAYIKLQGEYEVLKKQHAEDNGMLYPLVPSRHESHSFGDNCVGHRAAAAKEAFDAKVKESDEFVSKMKKEIENVTKRAKEKRVLESQVAGCKKTIEEQEGTISRLQSDLQKLSELRSKEKEDHDAELAAAREAVKNVEEYCAGRFAVFSESLSSELFFSLGMFVLITCRPISYCVDVLAEYSANVEAEQADMAKFAELMKKEYTPKSMEFALAQDLLTMRCTKAQKYAEETMGATLGLKKYLSPPEEVRVRLDTVVATLQEAPTQIARWKRSSARSGANYALALTKAHFADKVHNLERVGEGDPEQGPSCMTLLGRYAETASRIAKIPDLDFFVESTGVVSDSDEASDA